VLYGTIVVEVDRKYAGKTSDGPFLQRAVPKEPKEKTMYGTPVNCVDLHNLPLHSSYLHSAKPAYYSLLNQRQSHTLFVGGGGVIISLTAVAV
jgi:hypothetical protein